MLCKSANDQVKKKLHITEDIEYEYVNENYERYDRFLVDDLKDYNKMINCMNGLQISTDDQSDISKFYFFIRFKN